MDSDQFNAPPTATAALTAYFRAYGATSDDTRIDLVHVQGGADIRAWLETWRDRELEQARKAVTLGLQPVLGLSVYTWNAAEFLALARQVKDLLPDLVVVAGGPHVQQAEDYLGSEAIDVIFLGEAEISFQEFLDCATRDDWSNVAGLAYLQEGELLTTASRPRCEELDHFPSPLDVLQLTDSDGSPRYEIAACVPMGRPAGRFGVAPRKPASAVTHWNTFGNRRR